MDEKKLSRYIIFIPALAALLIEIFVFNFRTFTSLAGREFVFPIEAVEVQGASGFGEGVYRIDDEGSAVIYLKDLQQFLQGGRFQNMRINIYLPEAVDTHERESGCMYITPYVRDEGHDQYDILAEHVYREDIPDSAFLWITPAGKINTLALNCSLSEGSVFQIRSIQINAKRDMMLSPARIFILLVIAYAIFIFRNSSVIWKDDAIKKNMRNELLVAALGVCLIMPAFVINFSDQGLSAIKEFRPYQRLAEALADGQLFLKEMPSEELGQLSNPMDYTLREAAGLQADEDYLWDMAYYNGRYYCYFGIVPCLLFYLPVYLISGAHLSDGILMMLLAVFVYAGIYLAIREWIKKHKASVPFAYILLFTGMIFAGSGMMADISEPDAHDIPRAAGLAFTAWGLYLWQHSVRTDKRGLKGGALAAGSLLMALAVGCRPNQLVYSFLAIPLFVPYLKTDDDFGKKDRMRSIMALLIPYVPVAFMLMAYNALRFGSVLDFGYDYQLTVLDYSKKSILIDRIVIGLYEYLIRLPHMTYRFPFMEEGGFIQENAFGHGSFYYTWGYGGMLATNLLTWCIPVLFWGKKKEKGGIWLLGISLVNMMVNICVAGVAYHYRVDFAAPILAAGAIGALRLREKLGKDAEAVIKTFLITAFVLSMLYHSCFYYAGNLRAADTGLYYRLLYAWLG